MLGNHTRPFACLIPLIVPLGAGKASPGLADAVVLAVSLQPVGEQLVHPALAPLLCVAIHGACERLPLALHLLSFALESSHPSKSGKDVC